ncbi:MAG: serine/threonine protein kinase [Oscillatoriales cyanobacterium RM2_1_1]|nr:serine/threonine protein kinase [Oscillatoriales cyanobacterium SM2_3_0]NJO44839.1 serine/threonine protein kinase [Oscillatoriales cyanobacterium RM2_1_1]
MGIDTDQPTQPPCVIKQLLISTPGRSDLETQDSVDFPSALDQSNLNQRNLDQRQHLQNLAAHWQQAVRPTTLPDLWAVFEQDNYQYLVYEYVAGENLATTVAEGETFTEEQVWRLLKDILPNLQTLHQRGLIHGDIKPENIIQTTTPATTQTTPQSLSRSPNSPLKWSNYPSSRSDHLVRATITSDPEDTAPRPFALVDIGIPSKLETDGIIDDAHSNWGSAEYAAPEQLRGHPQPNSDLYSLGVTCLNALTHLPPFDLVETTSQQWVWQDYLQQPVSPRLECILDRLIERNPTKRYQSVAAVLKDMERSQHWRTLPQIQRVKWQFAVGTGAAFVGLILVLVSRLLGPGSRPIVYAPIEPDYSSPPTQSQPDQFPPTSGLPLVQTLKQSSGPVWAIAMSPNGQTVASGNTDGTIDILDFQGRILETLRGHSHPVSTLVFSPDNRILVSGSGDNSIKVWDLVTGELLKVLEGHQGWIYAIALSPDGKILASTGRDRTIRLWNLQTGQEFRQFQGYTDEVQTLAFTPDASELVAGSGDGMIELWNWRTGQLLRSIRGHSSTIWSVAVSADGRILATGSSDQTVKLWDLEQLKSQYFNNIPEQTLAGHHDKIYSLAFSSNSQILASGDFAGTINLWQMPTGSLIGTLKGHKSWVDLAFEPQGKMLVSGSFDDTIKVWQILP